MVETENRRKEKKFLTFRPFSSVPSLPQLEAKASRAEVRRKKRQREIRPEEIFFSVRGSEESAAIVKTKGESRFRQMAKQQRKRRSFLS